MPVLKIINGHSKSLAAAAEYFEIDKEGNSRALAYDGNIPYRSVIDPSLHWNDVMDRTREGCGANTNCGGKRAMTYKHIMISADPQDDITLDQFRDYIRDWCEQHLDNGSVSFQYAVLYHNDSSQKVERGEDGNLHAHIIVNNTELLSHKRISTLMTDEMIEELYVSANEMALQRGWHGFAENGKSMTLDEMDERGLKPSRNRMHMDPDQNVEAEYGVNDGYRNIPMEVTSDELGSDSVGKGAKPVIQLAFSDGRVYNFVPKNPNQSIKIEEREQLKREGHSWKQDIRSRVDCALRLSRNGEDFAEILDILEIDVSFNKKGEIKYSMRGEGNEAKQVLGPTLGKRYSKGAVTQAIALKHSARRQAATNPNVERPVSEHEREVLLDEAKSAKPGSREGEQTFMEMREHFAYTDTNRITGYGQYPKTGDGIIAHAWAKARGIFDKPDVIRPPTNAEWASMSDDQKIAYAQRVRDLKGHGGLEAGRATNASTPSHGSDCMDAGTAERSRNHNR